MNLICLILASTTLYADVDPVPAPATAPAGKIVERQRLIGSEALDIGECRQTPGPINRFFETLTHPSFVVAVSERVRMESFLVQVSGARLFGGAVEEVVPQSARPFDLLETYTKRFVGPDAGTECRLFVAALRQDLTFRYNAGQSAVNRQHVGYR